MPTRKTKSVAAYIKPDLHQRVKQQAEREDCTVSHLFQKMMTEYLDRQDRARRRRKAGRP